MSAQFPYLKLSLRYVRGAKSTNVFSFPSEGRPLRAPFDANAIYSRFDNLTEFYVTGCNNGRRFYSFVNLGDNDGERLELTLSVESDVLLAGRAVLNLFHSVKDMIEADEQFTDTSVCAALIASGFEENPPVSPAGNVNNNPEAAPAYRVFMSDTELTTMLSFPRQSVYSQFCCVALVDQSAVPVADEPLRQITEPVVQAFAVVCPPDVKASTPSVELSDRLTLTYTRFGFEPTEETFEVGTTNRYVRIAGPALIVNEAAKAGIVFYQHVAYKVLDVKGNPVKTYTILINGRTASRADGIFEISSDDFNTDDMVNITVSSTNFFTTSLNFTPAEVFESNPLEITLVPEEMQIILRMDFGEGRVIEQRLTVEKSSAEYRLLRAGNFHGFRSHRLMGSEPETYNVDMTAPLAPAQSEAARRETVKTVNDRLAETRAAAPAETPAEKPDEQPAPVAEERPKSAAELRAERLRRDIPVVAVDNTEKESDKKEKSDKKEDKKQNKKKRGAYTDDIPKKVDVLADDPDDDEEQKSRFRIPPMILAAVAVVLITAGIVWYLFTLLPSGDENNPENTEAIDITSAEGDANAARINVVDDIPDETAKPQPAAAPENASAADEKADIEYLNSREVWRLEDLKSEKFRALFNAFGNGDIEALAQTDYFAVTDMAKNRKAVKVMDYLWGAKGTFAEKRNVKELQSLKGKESIDINELYERLSRMQDSHPNKEPRPTR